MRWENVDDGEWVLAYSYLRPAFPTRMILVDTG